MDLDSGDSDSDDDEEGDDATECDGMNRAGGSNGAGATVQSATTSTSSFHQRLRSSKLTSSSAAEQRKKESKAGEEISALVNYVQAVRFHGFEQAESKSLTKRYDCLLTWLITITIAEKNRSYEMSSFDEASAVSLLKEFPLDFVKYNKRQISRIFPR